MARGVNKVILIGNLGQDPDVRYMPDGTAVANISVATSESWKDRATGEKKERTEWHRVVLFARLAEIAGQYLKKGSKVYVEGQLRTRKWQDKQGQDQYTTEVVVKQGGQLQMLDSQGGNGDERARQQTEAYGATGGTASQPPAATQPAGGFDDFDDDIPF